MIFSNITELVNAVKSELGAMQSNFSDGTITYIQNTALVIHDKILKGKNLSAIDVEYNNGLIILSDNSEIYEIRYTDNSGKIVVVDKSNFIQIDNQIQVNLPSSAVNIKAMKVKPYSIDDMPGDNIQLAFVYLVCDILLKQLQNASVGIQQISDGIMNIRYSNDSMSHDQSKYMTLYYKLIYEESSFKMDEV